MRRRDLMVGLLLVAIVGRAHAQQQRKVYRIAIVDPAIPADSLAEDKTGALFLAFYGELRRQGFAQGENLLVGLYSGAGRGDDFSELAREVVGWKPDVIFAEVNNLVLALKTASATTPIVGAMGDPVGNGIVETCHVQVGT
jgi:putative ABC transport system substrate-binding protein